MNRGTGELTRYEVDGGCLGCLLYILIAVILLKAIQWVCNL